MPQVSSVTNPNGVRLISGLFLETNQRDREASPYTLKDYDYEWRDKKYLSLFRRYMDSRDPTEYQFATTWLADWHHWELLSSAAWFQEHLKRWRKELELAIKSEALARLLKESKEPGRDGLSAAKYVLDKGWEPKETGGKGRPTKEQISNAANKIATESKLVDEHFERLGLKEIHVGNGLK